MDEEKGMLSPQKRKYYRSIFDKYDRNKDEKLNLKELKRIIDSNDNYDSEIPEYVVRRIFDTADLDGDKEIDFNEFMYMVEHPDFKQYFGHFLMTYINFLVPPQQRKEMRRLQRSFSKPGSNDSIDGTGWYEEQYSCYPPPFIMILFSIVEITLFLVDHIREPGSTSNGSGTVAVALLFDPSKKEQIWRFLTYMFVHIGYLHLVMNVIIQVVLALPLEMVHKWWRILIVYLSGVIAGSLFTSVADPYVLLAGASGGVYSILTCHIASVIMNWSEMTLPFVQLALFLLIVIADCGSSIYDRYFGDSVMSTTKVGYEAHLAGAVAGLCMGILVLKNLKFRMYERVIWWICLVFVIGSLVVMVGINLGWSFQ